MEKVSTGIEGLDKMLNGGLVPGRTYLVKGGPGSGKTTLATHFLSAGVASGERVMYITLEEPVDELEEEMSLFGFDVSKIEFIDAALSNNPQLNFPIHSNNSPSAENSPQRIVYPHLRCNLLNHVILLPC
ncbi:RAD55 family ATPase [Archaeoglobus veneficus]|uniref:KaiC domain-containing protein n=1 Tax=Archaeoglobus veneficus (strain DSM 11195 / SNP6) TaxID=693661 RepID=F2KSF1_ARCVS|nr:ATPase domain-containing protein [Archaeoglobus veneficus]AEA46920.1 hypothetical protein Arcve_0909 [Archaeoglobus veneficus SNP6]